MKTYTLCELLSAPVESASNLQKRYVLASDAAAAVEAAYREGYNHGFGDGGGLPDEVNDEFKAKPNEAWSISQARRDLGGVDVVAYPSETAPFVPCGAFQFGCPGNCETCPESPANKGKEGSGE